MKKLLLLMLIVTLPVCSWAIKYDLNQDDTITNVSSPSFSGYIQLSTSAPSGSPSAGAGWIYPKTDKKLYFKNADGVEYALTVQAGASMLGTNEDGVEISSPTLGLNFITFFNLIENPAGQANIYLDTTTLTATFLTTSSATATYLPKNTNISLNGYDIQVGSIIGYGGGLSGLPATGVPYTGATTNLDMNGYNISAGSFTGYGAGLTGITSGINLSDKGALEVTASTSINVGVGLSLDGVTLNNTVTDNNTIYAKPFSVRIGSYTGYGITHVADGVADQDTFFDAGQAAGSGGVVSVDPTMTYVWSSTCTIGTSSVTFIGNGAKLTFKSTNANADNIFFTMVTTATDVTFDNFVFDGVGASGTHWAMNMTSTRWAIKNCTFQNFPATSNGMMLRGAATYGTCTNVVFKNSAPTYAILNYNSNCNYSYIQADPTVTGRIELRGNDVSFTKSIYSGAGFYTGSYVYRHKVSNNFFIGNNESYAVSINSYDSQFTNNTVYNSVNGGVYFSPDALRGIIGCNLFATIGGTGDNADALKVEAPNCIVNANEFTGVIDRYCISLTATATDTNISKNNFNGATGQVANIYNLGSSNQAEGNVPVTDNFVLVVTSNSVTGMPNIVPKFLNTVVHVVGNTVWKSTGTSNVGDWQQISENGSTNADTLDGQDSSYFLAESSAASTYLTQSSATLTYLAQSSATITYLGIAGKAANSDLLDGQDFTYFLSESSATATYLTIIGMAADSDLLDGQDSSYFLFGSSATETYLSIPAASEQYVPYNGASKSIDVNSVPIVNISSASINQYIEFSTITLIGNPPFGKYWLHMQSDERLYLRNNLGSDVVLSSGFPPTPPAAVVPIAWYHFNEELGTTVDDSSPYGHDGTLSASEGYGLQTFVPGKLNNALSNAGEGESLAWTDFGNFANFNSTDTFSIDFWVNHAPYDVAIIHQIDNDTGKGWFVFIQSDYLALLMVGDYATEQWLQTYSTAAITTSEYNHIAITYNGNGYSSGVKMYINSGLIENAPYMNGLGVYTSTSTASCRVGANLPYWGSIGQIDELAIYDFVLSQEQINFRYNLSSGTESMPLAE
jgi:hypothetical protein